MASSIGDRVAELKKENDSNKDGFWEEFEVNLENISIIAKIFYNNDKI